MASGGCSNLGIAKLTLALARDQNLTSISYKPEISKRGDIEEFRSNRASRVNLATANREFFGATGGGTGFQLQ